MATLKEHQASMVDLLANGSGIPASASRLAHAMHDVLETMLTGVPSAFSKIDMAPIKKAYEATTPGLNDKALAADVEFCMPKPAGTPAERRVKELENTCGQLRNNLRNERSRVAELEAAVDLLQAEILDLRGLSNV